MTTACPSTNPYVTPTNQAMIAIKGGNAVIIVSSSSGYNYSAKNVELMREELTKSGFSKSLVQIIDAPVTKESTEFLIKW